MKKIENITKVGNQREYWLNGASNFVIKVSWLKKRRSVFNIPFSWFHLMPHPSDFWRFKHQQMVLWLQLENCWQRLIRCINLAQIFWDSLFGRKNNWYRNQSSVIEIRLHSLIDEVETVCKWKRLPPCVTSQSWGLPASPLLWPKALNFLQSRG